MLFCGGKSYNCSTKNTNIKSCGFVDYNCSTTVKYKITKMYNCSTKNTTVKYNDNLFVFFRETEDFFGFYIISFKSILSRKILLY